MHAATQPFVYIMSMRIYTKFMHSYCKLFTGTGLGHIISPHPCLNWLSSPGWAHFLPFQALACIIHPVFTGTGSGHIPPIPCLTGPLSLGWAHHIHHNLPCMYTHQYVLINHRLFNLDVVQVTLSLCNNSLYLPPLFSV